MTFPLNKEKQRSLAQNNAMHLYFEQVAEAMQDAGYDIKQIIPNNIEIPVTHQFIKSVWQNIGKEMFLKNHTAEFTKEEVGQVELVFSRWLATFGITIPFPSYDNEDIQTDE
mgnify:CR=1 FL=1